jgi:hypothetical protein
VLQAVGWLTNGRLTANLVNKTAFKRPPVNQKQRFSQNRVADLKKGRLSAIWDKKGAFKCLFIKWSSAL